MKLKRGILLIALTFILITVAGAFGSVQATTAITSKTLNIKILRDSGYGYKVSNNAEKIIWKIYDTQNDVNETFYCIKGGPGFGSSNMDSGTSATTYTQYFNMKSEKDIASTVLTNYINNLPGDTAAEREESYMKLMWVLDQCYIPAEDNASTEDRAIATQSKQTLLEAVEEYAAKYPEVYDNTSWINDNLTDNLTDDDIDIIQQLAIWYFTNSSEDSAEKDYHITGNPTIKINSVKDVDGNYVTFNTSDDEDNARMNAMDALYAYLTTTPETSGFTYDYTANTTTKVTLWTVTNPSSNDQPIVQIEKVGTVNFDLALRKFITSITSNGTTTSYDRAPVISNETLEKLEAGDITTLEKVHSKDALAVLTGDTVIYTIRIYNEGNIDGYATEVTDYLPAGLEFVSTTDSTINAKYGWEAKKQSDGTTIVTTTYTQNQLLKAFSFDTTKNNETDEVKVDRGLNYIDVQIECKVTASISNADTSLKNIAEITAHEDIDGNTGNIDIDSTVDNVESNPDKYNPQAPTKGIGEEDDDDFENLILPGSYFDLALRKFITSVTSGETTTSYDRAPVISDETLEKLANGTITTLEKVHSKDALAVKTGDTVIYTIRIYNEGDIDGYATEVTDYLPAGLQFISATESTINAAYGWVATEQSDGTTIVTTTYTKDMLLKAFSLNAEDTDETDEVKVDRGLNYVDIQIECKVTANVSDTDTSLKNIAEITAHKDIDGNTGDIDGDSKVDNVETDPDKYNPQAPTKGIGEEDDDDFEDLILPGKYFDLSLRKFITSVVNSNGEERTIITREPVVDTTPLLNGTATTANYNHQKEEISVSNGDIVTYTIRVYNEGNIDGYVTEITDYLPSQLEFIIDDTLNQQYGWKISSDGRIVTTDITSPDTTYSANRDLLYEDGTLLKAFDYTESGELDYIDVQIRCKVKENIDLYEKITNIAEITNYAGSEDETVIDRDSTSDSLTNDNSKEADNIKDDNLPTDENLPEYIGNTSNKSDLSDADYFYKGQQDDDDFEKLVLRRFDLALKKFITEVKNEDGSNVQTITNRAPVFSIEDGVYTYTHTKEPVEVANSNIVTYTLRIFNEGNVSGYATTIKDDIPEGLEFLPDDVTNIAFGWKMYTEDGEITDDVSKAVYIATDFLSKENEENTGDNLIASFDPDTMTMPAYKDIKVAFKVTEPNTSDRIVINQAQIADDSDEDGNPIDDVDSEPNVWTDGEDDQDIEKIKVKYFDLSLRKWVTESIVTYNGKTTVTKSGNKAEDDPEAPMKVEIQTANISKTTVKFKYSIKVTNEGEIAGYAKELIDYIPDGLKFVAEDNPLWTKNEDGTVTTDQLKDTLLEPGESATVEIILTWINGKDNMGEKVNWAEISEDYNEYGSPDIDSTPGNDVKDEDDIDEAPVLLSPATGSSEVYAILTLVCITMIAGGVFLIKKFII